MLLLTAGVVAVQAQNVIDNFRVGPYIVDYHGPGNVKYRLREDIDLYDYFGLKRDTTVVEMITKVPVKYGLQFSGRYTCGPFSSKEAGFDGVWKQRLGGDFYFNGGLFFSAARSDDGAYGPKRVSASAGIPLQLEWSRLNRQFASLYGVIGLEPALYATLQATDWDGAANKRVKARRNYGLRVAPVIELGGNVPVGGVVMRFGIVGTYKITRTLSENMDPYIDYNNNGLFFGTKIGIIL